MRLTKLLTAFAFTIPGVSVLAQSVNLTPFTAYTQNFDGLTGTTGANDTLLNIAATLPSGWFGAEAGSGANATLRLQSGAGNAGDTILFGDVASTERALGGLLSGSLTPTIGASFTNNSLFIFDSLNISYVGEAWRTGTATRNDGFDFQYSTDATSLTTGTWLDWNPLDYQTISGGTVGATNGNSITTSVSSTITGLSIAPAATFWIRWNDLNATTADDGRAVDNFSITPVPEPSTYAALAGLAVLGFAAYRRRKS